MLSELLCQTTTQKCIPVRNPCKICLEKVTNRNGLQCQGACKRWAHYKCLHYTPGEISDIKAGLFKVLCPCPDCETPQEEEYLTNPPDTCLNRNCSGKVRSPDRYTLDEFPHNAIKKNKNCCSPKCRDDAINSRTQTTDSSSRQSFDDPPSEHAESQTRTKQPISNISKKIKKEKKSEKDNNTNKNYLYDDLGSEEQDEMKIALQEMYGTVTQLSEQIKELLFKIKMKEENQVKVLNKPK